MKGPQGISAALRSGGPDDVTEEAVARVLAARRIEESGAIDAVSIVEESTGRRWQGLIGGAADLAPMEVEAAAGVASAGRPVTAGVMHEALLRLVETTDAWTGVPPREVEAMRWVIRGEMRKLAALDRYTSGVVRA